MLDRREFQVRGNILNIESDYCNTEQILKIL